MKIGDRVTNQRLGPIYMGEVVLVCQAYYYDFLAPHRFAFGGAIWDEAYPEWKNNNLVVIRMDQSTRACTWEEAEKQNASRRQWEDMPATMFHINTSLDLVNLSSDEGIMIAETENDNS